MNFGIFNKIFAFCRPNLLNYQVYAIDVDPGMPNYVLLAAADSSFGEDGKLLPNAEVETLIIAKSYIAQHVDAIGILLNVTDPMKGYANGHA